MTVAAFMLSPTSGAADYAVSAPRPLSTEGQNTNLSGRDAFSVMTFNVKGLPWPIASGRRRAAQAIGMRLKRMRAAGTQPRIVLLQEAFGETGPVIAKASGYPFMAVGPREAEPARLPPLGRDFADAARWDRGERSDTLVDSGLVILSDFPIVRSRKLAFPRGACAGFDCLAAKGLLVAWIDVPGLDQPLAIADTHLNARRAAGVASDRADEANRWQVHAIGKAISEWIGVDDPAIIGGDWNIGKATARKAEFQANPPLGPDQISALDAVNLAPTVMQGAELSDEVEAIRTRNKDKILARSGADAKLRPVGVSVPFGQKQSIVLSDHAGFAITFEL